jgi:hypothetical protein
MPGFKQKAHPQAKSPDPCLTGIFYFGDIIWRRRGQKTITKTML